MCGFSIVTSWEVNAIGHPVVLPLTVCEELLQVMDDSNATLPASMRCMRSYEVRQLLCTEMGNRWWLGMSNSLHSRMFFDIFKMLMLILRQICRDDGSLLIYIHLFLKKKSCCSSTAGSPLADSNHLFHLLLTYSTLFIHYSVVLDSVFIPP